MMRSCIVLNGKVINIGEWDYQVRQVEVGLDENNQPIFENQITNPLPEGAEIVEIDIVEGPDGGLYPSDVIPPKSPHEQVQELQMQNGELLFKLAVAQDDLQQKTTQMGMMLMQLATIQGGN